MSKELLEHFISENPDVVRNITAHMDSTEGWKEIVNELQKYRVPVFLNINIFDKVHSPSTYLLNELTKRACKIQDFKDLLKRSRLLDVLSFLENPEPIEILIQPGKNFEKISVEAGEELRLECVAIGLPPPKYQWYCDNNMLSGCTSSSLVIPDFKEDLEGEYYCIIKQQIDENIVQLTSNTVICSLLESLPEILKSPPRKLYPKLGSEVKLEVTILCRSDYKIEWIKENQFLQGENSSVLWIKQVELSDTAVYRCVVRNKAGEVFSEPCELFVTEPPKKNKASAKVALLIANSKYDNFSDLHTPTADILLLAEKLEALGFITIPLINLTLKEMKASIQWFFDNIPPKAYAFFCYVGHGFLLENNKFMMPVDCPEQNQYKKADCIWDELLIKNAKEKKLRLLVKVLDMCLKGPDSLYNPDIFNERYPDYSYKPYYWCSVVQASATSNYQSAYENPNMTYGLYIDHICKYFQSDNDIVHIFKTAYKEFKKTKVIELQTPTLFFDANMNFKFSDPVDGNMEKLLPFTKAKELQCHHELYFPAVNLHSKMFAMPHRGKILNAIDLQFSQTVSNQSYLHAFIHLDFFQDLTCCQSTTDDGCLVLSIFNIQKVKSNIYITPALSYKEGQVTLQANDVIDLGLPLIASAQLWLIQD